ncbi:MULTISPECIES: glycosyltransferase family 2 protein [unclassified Frankia]
MFTQRSGIGASVDVVLPCLDEAGALPWVLDRMPVGYRPIVADNGSRDGSRQVALERGAVVVDVPERGYGAAVHAGLLAADASLDPAELPGLVAQLLAGRADLVLGRRRPTSMRAWPPHARFGNAVVAGRLRRRGVPVHDLGPMRVARREDLLRLPVADRRFGYPLELLLRAAQAGWRIIETDVAYTPRVGRSKVTGTPLGAARTARDTSALLASLR